MESDDEDDDDDDDDDDDNDDGDDDDDDDDDDYLSLMWTQLISCLLTTLCHERKMISVALLLYIG